MIARGDPDRNGLLHGFGLYAEIRKTIILAREGERLLGPQTAHNLDRFVEPSGALAIRHAAGFEFNFRMLVLVHHAGSAENTRPR